MNHVYKQDGGTCVAMALCNGIEDQLGLVVPKEEIEKYFKEHFHKGLDGVRLPKMLQRMKVDPLYGVKVKSYKCLYNSRKKKELFSSIVRTPLHKKEGAIIMNMKIRNRKKGEKKIEIDKDGFYKPRTDRNVRSHHAMYIARTARVGMLSLRTFFVVENSWGTDWGRDGCFYMTFPVMRTEAQSIYLVNFEL
jgi:hypothetical protein|tara:strand:- start:6198 stop:6773 length:576 start_codon:yes stop_codon:yes gene_type:complete